MGGDRRVTVEPEAEEINTDGPELPREEAAFALHVEGDAWPVRGEIGDEGGEARRSGRAAVAGLVGAA